MKILFLTSEAIPYAASGGLADVAEALPVALHKKGMQICRVMPKYKGIEKKYELHKELSFIVEAGGEARIADVYTHTLDQVTTYFIGNQDYFERDELYGYGDDDERFGFFCKAALEMLILLDLSPDIMHLNDWQTALIGLIIRQEYAHIAFYKKIKLIFTIHNLQYQGVFDRTSLFNLNLSSKHFNTDAVEYYGKVCFMKAGIVYAHLITTVSKTYAIEMQTHEYGYGLDGLLRKYTDKITGIVNGIYYDKYNPKTDQALAFAFDQTDFKVERAKQKKAFQQKLGLPVVDRPLLGVVTRLAEQKGIVLIVEAIKALIEEDFQFVILGSGDKNYERELKRLSEQYPDKIKLNIQFNQSLAREIYGSSDLFLMPSLFEPCGLSQLYSLRYGAVPVVRATGGLVDTIIDYNANPTAGTGFSFINYTSGEFVAAIRRALFVYQDTIEWQALIKRGLETRFSWEKAAQEYIAEYKKVSLIQE